MKRPSKFTNQFVDYIVEKGDDYDDYLEVKYKNEIFLNFFDVAGDLFNQRKETINKNPTPVPTPTSVPVEDKVIDYSNKSRKINIKFDQKEETP